MFGYIRVFENELKIKEYKLYRHCYCELCKNMGKYSQWSRLFHSYDLVFYYMLYCDNDVEITDCKKKCNMCFSKVNQTQKSRFFAALSIALTYHKLDNDVIDGDAKKRFLRFLVKRAYKKTLSQYPNMGQEISECLKQLLIYEKNKCRDYVFLSDYFGECIGRVTAQIGNVLEDKHRQKIISLVSACVYLIDILDDVEKDAKNGDYNPLNIIGNGKARLEDIVALKGLVFENLSQAMEMLELLPYTENTAVLRNILSFGMPMRVMEIYNRYLKSYIDGVEI